MKKTGISPGLKRFAGKTILVFLGIVLLAGVVALFTHQHFGMILFVLGLFFLVIGFVLGEPNPPGILTPPMRNVNFLQPPPPEELTAQNIYYVKNVVPLYSFENAVALAGLIAVIIALIILFGKMA